MEVEFFDNRIYNNIDSASYLISLSYNRIKISNIKFIDNICRDINDSKLILTKNGTYDNNINKNIDGDGCIIIYDSSIYIISSQFKNNRGTFIFNIIRNENILNNINDIGNTFMYILNYTNNDYINILSSNMTSPYVIIHFIYHHLQITAILQLFHIQY